MKSVPSKIPGIRIKGNGKFLACKTIQGKKYYKELGTLREAQNWKNAFHPLVSPAPKTNLIKSDITVSGQTNGDDHQILFREVVDKYKQEFLKSLGETTQYKKELRMSKFLPELYSVPMCKMMPATIVRHIDNMKLLDRMKLLKEGKSRRCNFEKELKDLSSIFNWYSENYDFKFVNPVKPSHRKLSKIREVPKKDRKMTIEEFAQMFEHLNYMDQTIALCQLLGGNRIGETTAINDKTVDFKRRLIFIEERIVWIKSKPKHIDGTKTEASGRFPMPDELYERLMVLKEKRPKGCIFFFQRKGKPVRYNLVLSHYNKALKAANLGQYTGTHIIRHAMANLARKYGGEEVVKIVLRHTSTKQSEKYGELDVNQDVSNVVIHAAEEFRKARIANA